MKRFFNLCLLSMVLGLTAAAQDVDMTYVFVEADGTVLDNGATVVRNTVEEYDVGTDVIYSDISVKNTGIGNEWLRVIYHVERLDNGAYQICFPTSCNSQIEIGDYVTPVGQLMGNVQNIESEWFPVADGTCQVTLTIELMSRIGSFPNFSYVHKAYGPSLTIKFVKGELPPEPKDGDVNGDGEVNIADVNAVVDMILSQQGSASGDVNHDSEINIADVNALISMILGSN